MNKRFAFLFVLFILSLELSQELTQTIRGEVVDETSEVSLPRATYFFSWLPLVLR